LIDQLNWRWTFYINVPFGILVIILGALVFSTGSANSSRSKIDFRGAGLFAGGLISLLYGITHWANNPHHIELITWILLPLGILFMVLFYREENRATNPMIDLQLLKWRPFLAANVYNFIYGAVVFGMFSFIPYYAVVAYKMTAGQTGIILTPRSVAMVVMAALTSFLLIKLNYRRPMILGTVLASASLVLLSRGFHDVVILGSGVDNLVILMVIIAIGGIGMGIANPAANNAILDMVPEKVATVTGMRGMFRISGGIFGTAGVVLTLSFYQDKGLGLQHVALFFAVLLLCLIPVIFMIPDSVRTRSPRRERIHHS
jgi:MFS family permease